MADISKIKIGATTYDIKDAVAREAMQNITGAMHWVGITTTVLADGSTTNPIIIGGSNVTAVNGDVVGYGDLEFVFNGTKWQEFGSTGSLKALAFKDSASGKFTPSGTNAQSEVTIPAATYSKLDLITINGVSGTESVSKVTRTTSKLVTTSITPVSGTESVSKVTKTSSKLATTTIKGVSGTATVHDTPTLSKEAIGSASGWSAGTMFAAAVDGETLTLTPGTAPSLTVTSKQVGTGITAGTAVVVAKAADTATTVATGSVDANGGGSAIVTDVTISDKTVAKAGTSVDVATGAIAANGAGAEVVNSVIVTDKTVAKAAAEGVQVATGTVSTNGDGAQVTTAVPTKATAAAQKFTGTQGTVSVS